MKKAQGGADPHEQKLTLARFKMLKNQSASRRTRVPRMVPVVRGTSLPLSYAQERLWFLDQLGMVGSAYNIQTTLRLEGQLDVSALERSFSELLQRHESLRTHFESVDGSPIQVVDPPRSFALRVQDLSGLPQRQKQHQVQHLSGVESQRPFSLSEGHLFRASLLKLAEDEHVLLLTIHHIVTDGWSSEVIHRELSELYGAYSQGQSSPLPEMPIQYADYAVWQRQCLEGEILQNQLQYWREQLSGAPLELRMPTDRPRNSLPGFTGARLSFEIRAELHRAITELARHEEATPFMLVLAAYQVLLARHCRQQDVVVGAPVAGRTHAQTDGLIGFFVNTLVLRTDLSGNPSFRQLLRRVKEVTMGAYAHQDLPFEKLVMELRPERNLTRQPFFQVALAMQNYPEARLNLRGLTCTRVHSDRVNAPFDLSLNLIQVSSGLRGEFVYATNLFDAQTIARMAAHFQNLLEGAVTNPDCNIERLPMLPPQERNQILHEFNDTTVEYPQHRLIHELFEEQVQRSPDAIAVVYEGRTLTYAGLNSKANQLACHLREQGVGFGEYIPIVMPRCLQMLIAQLAVLKAGAVYVPVDPSIPEERQVFVMRDCGARTVLTADVDGRTLGQEHMRWIVCSEVGDAFARLPTVNVNLNLRVDSPLPAYVMYTSGSTGIPKGVVVPHRAVNRLVVNCNYSQLGKSDCIAHCSNPAFDASTFEIWGALLNGAKVLIVPQWDILEAKRFAHLLIEHQVTVLWLTVGLFTQYADALAPVFLGLRYLMTGGDIVEPGAIRRVLDNCSPKHLLSAYGPTECTTFSTTYSIEVVAPEATSIPIGRPISNTRVYILDGHLQPSPIGVSGEIYIGGPGVALGYLNRPGLTAERFIKDPFSTDTQARMYRSGDLGRWRADGNIDFLGRNDQQVKLRGFRIELGEIEAQLVRLTNVKEAVVVAQEVGAEGKRLVAYVTSHDGVDLTPRQLRAQLEALMPEYMVPSAFVIMESFPLTPNGKLDRRALPMPQAEACASREYESPQGDLEERLASIWQELLQIERVGRKDSFFDLGGHSLLVLKALFKVNKSFSCALNVQDVYRNPILRDLAARIGGRATEEKLIDLSREATLDERIVANSERHRVPPQGIMLTGGTGFVGKFLLARLLQDTRAIIYCLVRASSPRAALVRLRMALVERDLWRDEFESRIVPIIGDLRLPRLGLNDDAYRTLSENVDSIFHCATSMNHLETYTMAKTANIEATKELLKLSTHQSPKLMNYVSTLSVFSRATVDTTRVVNEESPIDDEKHLASSGYAASKWVSEKIIMIAGGRGIPCNIFRLGLVWADARHGHYDELQREHRVLKSCLISGYGIENYRYEIAPTPVDYVARAMVCLATRNRNGRGIFHISSSGQMLHGVFERCNDVAGTSLELVSLYDWICEIKRLHLSGLSLPIVPLIEFAFAMSREAFCEHQYRFRSSSIQFDNERTNQSLELAGIVAPVLDDDLLRKCVEKIAANGAEVRECGSRSVILPRNR